MKKEKKARPSCGSQKGRMYVQALMLRVNIGEVFEKMILFYLLVTDGQQWPQMYSFYLRRELL